MIKFQKHFVTDGKIKARCSYHAGNDIHGRARVVLYAKDYSDGLGLIFSEEYKNETDLQSDYFDKGDVTLYSDHPLYAAALERSKKNDEAFDLRWKKLQQKRQERYAASHSGQGIMA